MKFKFKKEKVYILKKNKKGVGFVKQLTEVRTFEYKGHKFNLQGNSRDGYAVSDNATGMLIGAYFFKLKGLENYLYLTDHKDISGYFSHVLLQEFTNKPNYFDINANTTNGILGLARNYTSDVVVAESYLFGVSASFSIMNYLTSNKLLNVSMFSIYKDKLILGDVPIAKEDRNNVKICKPINLLDETFELFFWNCETNFINIFGV